MDVVSIGMARADAKKKYLLRPNTLIPVGDSLIEQGGGAPISTGHRSYGLLTWAQYFMGQRLAVLRNAGVGGQRSDEILARLQTDVIAYRPGYVLGIAGTNDVSQAIPVATIKANLTAIWDKLDAAGIRTVWCTIPPRNTYTGTMLADTGELNAWIRGQGRNRPNLRVADTYAALVKFDGSQYPSAWSADGIHPGNKAAPAAGKAVADAFAQIIGPVNSTSLDLASGELDVANIQTQSRFSAGAVASNTPPTGWTQASLVGGPVLYERVARTDGLAGSWLRLTVPAGCSGVLRNPNALLSQGRFAIGDTVKGSIEVRRTLIDQAPAAGVSGFGMYLYAVPSNAFVAGVEWAPGNDNQASFDQYGVMETEPFVTPAATTQFQMQLVFSGAQVIDLDRATIRNITRHG
jgi:lysophospholipase L1-like esterase